MRINTEVSAAVELEKDWIPRGRYALASQGLSPFVRYQNGCFHYFSFSCLIISKSPSASMAKMQVNVEMEDLTKEEEHPAIEFAQPNRKGWWVVCVFPKGFRRR